MVFERATLFVRTLTNLRKFDGGTKLQLRAVTTPSGAIPPAPKRTRFGFMGVLCSIVTGILIGSTLSKMVANFLEETELFVPSDDDDDDD